MTKLLLFTLFAVTLACSNARGSLTFLYDFPGNPEGSGLAADQTNPQPAGATFSDFARNGGLIDQTAQNQFNSGNWSTSATLDPAVYVGFTITANPGFALALTSLTFDSMKNGVGPGNAQVSLFLNGAATPYATFAWTPASAPITSYTFDFPDLTPSDNVTTATFEFFGWNATDATNQMRFDNVATFGTIEAVPEISAFRPILLLIGCVLIVERNRRTRLQFTRSHGL
jgi:hypothetical protein